MCGALCWLLISHAAVLLRADDTVAGGSRWRHGRLDMRPPCTARWSSRRLALICVAAKPDHWRERTGRDLSRSTTPAPSRTTVRARTASRSCHARDRATCGRRLIVTSGRVPRAPGPRLHTTIGQHRVRERRNSRRSQARRSIVEISRNGTTRYTAIARYNHTAATGNAIPMRIAIA